MKIAIITDNFPARSETFIVNHALGLRQAGHEVHVISSGPAEGIQEDEISDIKSKNIQLHETAKVHFSFSDKIKILISLIWSDIHLLGKLLFTHKTPKHALCSAYLNRKKIDEVKPDVIHIHYGHNAANLLAAGFNKKAVVTWHGYDANVLPKVYGGNMYEQLFKSDCDQTVGSHFMRRRLIELGANAENIHVIPMGIDTKKFIFEVKTFSENETLQIISVGRLDYMKGHRYLIDAVKLLSDNNQQVKLTIVGQGALENDLRVRVIELGLEESVVFVGTKKSDELVTLMRRAHVFALCGVIADDGRVETQGVVYAEAQACGLPVVAADVGGVSESLVDGVTGFLCKPGNPPDIAQAIIKMIEQPQLITEFGKKGRDFIEKRFEISAMINSFVSIYEKLKLNS
jgi:colanic acid/amylovoran biosynthesis glycosyltransferase